jgi:intracellular sulfur oxidation DsrE/DsrF family protein
MWSVAGEPSFGPAIEGYGPTYPIHDRDVQLEDGFEYRAVFDIANSPDDKSRLNPRLVSVARYLNMHARNGVPVEHMHLGVVVHGSTLANVLNHDAFKTRFNRENPNLELVFKLHEAGVRFYACGQSMAFGGIVKSELANSVQTALSAMTMLTALQSEGYALLP